MKKNFIQTFAMPFFFLTSVLANDTELEDSPVAKNANYSKLDASSFLFSGIDSITLQALQVSLYRKVLNNTHTLDEVVRLCEITQQLYVVDPAYLEPAALKTLQSLQVSLYEKVSNKTDTLEEGLLLCKITQTLQFMGEDTTFNRDKRPKEESNTNLSTSKKSSRGLSRITSFLRSKK